MKHIVYKTTNLINGKYYIGKHSCTCSGKCNYLGSGSLIKRAIEKYGKEKFKREILSIFQSEKEAYEYEKEILTKKIIKDNMSYNLIEGGLGFNSEQAKRVVTKKPCVIEGKKYDSIIEAARDLNKNPSQIKTYRDTGNYPRKHVNIVTIDGIEFEDNTKAAKHFNTTRYTIVRWINNQGSRNIKSEKISNERKAKKCTIDNIDFNSYTEAGKYFDVSPNIIKKWIKINNGKSRCKQCRKGGKPKKCVIKGIEYESIEDASRKLNLPRSQIRCYLKNGFFKKERGTPIVIEGKIYNSIAQASKKLKISPVTIRRKLKDGIYKLHPVPITSV